MKQSLALVILSLFLICSFQSAYGQTKKIISYNLSLPLGNTSNFINRFSFRGGSFEVRQMLGDDYSVGILGGWHVLNKATYATYTENTFSISGKQFRTINSVPILLTAHRYFRKKGEVDEEIIRPYAGAGIGMQYVNKNMDLGNYTLSDKNWHFGVAPELGIIFPVSISYNHLSIVVSSRLHYAFKAADSPSFSYLNFNVGLQF